MVIYDLVCEHLHEFEGWFKNSDDFAEQVNAKLLRCPICDSENVERKLSPVNVASAVSRRSVVDKERSAPESESVTAAKQAMSALMRVITPEERMEVVRDFVEKNFEDVGDRFCDEARKMHYGETEERGIRGQATAEDVADLEEEGIATIAIPDPKRNKQLN